MLGMLSFQELAAYLSRLIINYYSSLYRIEAGNHNEISPSKVGEALCSQIGGNLARRGALSAGMIDEWLISLSIHFLCFGASMILLIFYA